MKRRDFITNTSLASSLLFVPNFIQAFQNTLSTNFGYKRLVIIQLNGGNDGLNTVIPFRNDIYFNSRPKLALHPEPDLHLTDDLRLHPSLLPLKQLYDNGNLSIINNVGYPNPNRSHFRATDIWHTASDSNAYYQNGWIGRYLDAYGNHPYNAIEINESLSLALKGKKLSGIAVKNPDVLFRLSQDPFLKQISKSNSDEHLNEHNLDYLYKTMITAESSVKYIHEKYKIKQTGVDYPNTAFANQLKLIASFINSQLKTKVFYAALDGFDTHVNQHNVHSRLLSDYAIGVSTFVKDLKNQDTFKDTLILTFSEFGRRLKQNSGNGTDHGSANNLFVIGKNLKRPGVYNELASLSNLDDNGDIKFEVDFRQVYATVLQKWLEIEDTSILKGRFNQLNFI
jgi:uncharacterized protein (DUF1501 family)